MPSNAGYQIFRFDADTDFHRRPSDVVDARFQHDEIAEVNRLAKVDTVDRRGDAGGSRMPDRRDGSGLVHERHHDATEYVAEIVRVRREHECRRFVLRLSDGSARARAWFVQGLVRRVE